MVNAINANGIDSGIFYSPSTVNRQSSAVKENYPGYLNITYNPTTKKLSIIPTDVPSNIKPYKAITIRDANGRNVLNVERVGNQTEIVANNLGAVSKSTISIYDLKDIVQIEPNKTYYLYQLDQSDKVHSTKLSVDFWKTNAAIAPTVYLTAPAIDKATQALVDNCLFSKPKFDGKEYAWKGDVNVNYKRTSTYNAAQFRLKFNQLPNTNEVFIKYGNIKGSFNNQQDLVFTKAPHKSSTDTLEVKNVRIQTNKWYSFAFSGSKVYLNGKNLGNLYPTKDNIQLIRGNAKWEIADLVIWDLEYTDNNGWKNSFSEAELKQYAEKIPSPTDKGVIALFDIDEGNGTQFINSVGGNPITATATGDCKTDWVVSKYINTSIQGLAKNLGNVMNFCTDKGTGLISGIDLANKSFSIEFMARRSRTGQSEYIINQGTGGKNTQLHIGFRQDDRFVFAFWDNDLVLEAKYGQDTDWHQWSCTYDATTKIRRVYRDGLLVGEDKNVAAYQGKGDIQMAHQDYNNFYNGQLDDLRIWSEARSADDVKANMAASLSNLPNTLLAYTKFEKYTNNTVYNEVTKKNDIGFQGIADKPLSDIQAKYKCNLSNYLNFCDKNKGYGDISGIDLKNKSFTIEFLAKKDKDDSFQFSVSQGKAGHNQLLRIGWWNDNRFQFGFYNDDLLTKAKYLTDNQWHHWACVYDKNTKKQIIYRDGVEIANRISKNDFQGSGDLRIGQSTEGAYEFKGDFRELRIWDNARTPKEIKDHVNKIVKRNENNLIAYYKFDGKKAYNEVSQKEDITFKNWTYCVAPTSKPPTPKSTDNYFTLCTGNGFGELNGIDFANKSFTIEFMARRQRTGTNEFVLTQGQANNNSLLHIGFARGGDNFTFGFWGNELVADAKYGQDTDWHHWSCTYDVVTKIRRIYRDGQLIAENKTGKPYQGTGKMTIGKLLDRDFFKGDIDELRIWKTARSSGDIAANVNQPLPIISSDLLAYYKFEKVNKNAVYNEVTQKEDITFQNNDCTNHVVNFCKKNSLIRTNILSEIKDASFTIEFWAKSISKEDDHFYIDYDEITIKMDKGKFLFQTYNPTTSTKIYATLPTDNNGHHWTCIYDKTNGQIIIYLDGKEVAKGKSNKDKSYDDKFTIRNIKGAIDEFRVWKTVRTPQQIKDNISKSIAVTSDLIFYSKFDKEQNGKAYNEVTKKYDITLENQPTIGIKGQFSCKSVTKPIVATKTNAPNTGKVLDFCVSNGTVEIEGVNLIPYNSKYFTIEFWSRRLRKGVEEYIMGQEGKEGIRVGYNDKDQFFFSFDDAGGGRTVDAKYGQDTEWHHWALVFQYENYTSTWYSTIYHDGVLISGLLSGQALFRNYLNGKIHIGEYNNKPFTGQVDEFRIWHEQRNEADIKKYRNAPLTTIPTSLKSYLKFEDIKGNLFFDDVTQKYNRNSKGLANSNISTSDKSCGSPPINNPTPTALNLNGKDIYAVSNNSIDLSNKSFTIEFWADAHKKGVVNYKDVYGGTAIGHGTLGKTKEHLALKITKSGLHHYTYVFDNTNKKIIHYIDGKKEKEEIFNGHLANAPLIIGRAAAGGQNIQPFKGAIDEVRVWNKALDANLIARHYKWKYDNTVADLLLYYDFENNQGTTITDVKGTNNGQVIIPINPKYAFTSSNIKLRKAIK